MSHGDVRARVEQFVADFYEHWERVGRPPAEPSSGWREAYDAWIAELAGLASRHGGAGLRTGAEGSLSGLAAHDPAHETITDVQVEVDQARVRSVMAANPPATYYEYRLARIGEEWRIVELRSFLDPPGTRLVEAAEAERLLASASVDAPLSQLSADLELDVPGLFADGRDVVRLGEITVSSGVLSVCDLAWAGHGVEPLARRIPVGTYPVEVASAAGTNVALRLVLADAPAVSWHPAETVSGTNVVGVDAGSVAIVDLGSLVDCEAQQIEGTVSDVVPGTVFALGDGRADAVLVTSGYGDGAYPCYWGAAADGSVTSLVVDFQVPAEATTVTVTVPWKPGPVASAELAGCDLLVTAHGDSFTISHRGQIANLRVLGGDGSVLVDGHHLVLTVDDRHRQTWTPATPPPPGSVLEVTASTGSRHG